MAQDARPARSKPARYWPLFPSLASYSFAALPGDLIAGLTLAAIAIPEQMATARLGGFEPQIGFFAFMAGSLGFALLGAYRFLSCGADSTITPIFAGGLAALAATGSHSYQALAIALALMVGAMLVLSGIFKLGGIANLLSVPVTVGFLAGISVHILISQLPGILGLPAGEGPMLQRFATLAEHYGVLAGEIKLREPSPSRQAILAHGCRSICAAHAIQRDQATASAFLSDHVRKSARSLEPSFFFVVASHG